MLEGAKDTGLTDVDGKANDVVGGAVVWLVELNNGDEVREGVPKALVGVLNLNGELLELFVESRGNAVGLAKVLVAENGEAEPDDATFDDGNAFD